MVRNTYYIVNYQVPTETGLNDAPKISRTLGVSIEVGDSVAITMISVDETGVAFKHPMS